MTVNVQLSGKHDDGTIFVVGGANYDEFFQNLIALNEGDLERTQATIAHASAIVNTAPGFAQGVANAQAGFQQAPPQQPYQAPQYQQPAPQQAFAPPANQPPPGQAAPVCVHGPRQYKAGRSKAGKDYKMWSCPSSDRNNQCPPEWVN